MGEARPESAESMSDAPGDFSLVLGGPLFQLWRRVHLTGPALQLLRRRIVWLVLLAWAPLLALSAFEGHAWGRSVRLPFLLDVELQVRLLVALPLLIWAELVIHRRGRLVAAQFLERRVIPERARASFDAVVASALRLRDSVVAELILIGIVYVVGVGVLWRTRTVLDITTWYGMPVDGVLHPSLAGWWLGLVSLPLFQFLMLRWYYRLLIWARFLWQVSRLPVTIVPTHPDRAGGLGFLSQVSLASSPFLFAQGAMLAGVLADRILFAGATLSDFKVEITAVIALLLIVILGPMLAFTPRLIEAKNAGLLDYGRLAELYVSEFDRKWLRGRHPVDERLIGSADIQSLADLGTGYEVIRGMRWVPFSGMTIVHLALATLLPVLPLILTLVSVDELFRRVVKILF